ncbi:NADP-dependent isocitrate dehydrogenase [Lawsonibacter faecis]|uniref:Isocitrate dehydrogenase [NADP] n=1 Tax=Lawsonibacter faecis TaxID=2763052 RepID=A0A8J6MD02_9FIRM|nr:MULTISPECIES: NADP-dependent isocitrate dehydrogenase [Oscillospiraceae]MTQ98218.1 NADP-dependent isocitrate dehydrogenase [Pseudoflavonifractor sp. BIOML-A16]MTR06847.1 NADP-dependent isocitrate dehydrogenase [Pseudoflavonifractor sp. BIOML-A15]MTR31833.1 NADP-dependent isocitrate dehydrogenase [Pseudoflavonifractor sp. BIOML-A14]MTR73588.1 NADP-dependent isocitrate dehydrogenase [Pseudoflavonifractor sp. BIOML-A18]MTS64871.1 NADP-dependent isocitrate dehydrogenase [Pseudoflavonifractor sp
MEKIKMTTPLVELDGDEMTRILWADIKSVLLEPYIDLKTVYFDLGLPEREKTADQVTVDSANAIKEYGVGVKCATITPNAQRVEEYQLTEMWKSPNGTIRAILDGTVFRAPIMVKGISPVVKNWKEPITIARHAYGDVYRCVEYRVPGPGVAELVFSGKGGTDFRQTIFDFDGAGVIQGQYNKDESISSFARSCFQFAIDTRQDLWFSTKDTISKKYDHTFKDIFADIYEAEYRHKFESLGITYFYTLIDDAVARVIRSKGGFIWACKNYDGDVMSDMVSTAFGSLAMMTSVLVSPDGKYEYEAAHGTVTQHYYRYLQGENPSTNPMATIFAWTGALAKRGELDGNAALTEFAHKLEQASVATIESGVMTKDLAGLWEGELPATAVDSGVFLQSIKINLEKLLEA